MMRKLAPMLAAALVLAASAPVEAAGVAFAAHLLGATAHTGSDAFAEAEFTYDSASRKLDYYVNYDGVAPMKVDIHGPATGNESAPALLSLPVSESPISGTTTLSAQAADMLMNGKTYIDIHSRSFPNGEIGGWITRR